MTFPSKLSVDSSHYSSRFLAQLDSDNLTDNIENECSKQLPLDSGLMALESGQCERYC